MKTTKTITNLRALTNHNLETKKQNIPNPLESFQRNFPQNVQPVTVNTLSPLFPSGVDNIQNQILHNSKVVKAFYAPMELSLFVMDPLEGRYIASNASGFQSGDSNMLENAGDILDNLSDFF
jgi:hypothetical protein